jgi:hypothetical protein
MNNQQSWDSYIEISDWRRKRWRFNYTKHVTSDGWCLDWEILNPDRSIKASGEKDSSLAHRCLNELGVIDNKLLEHEVKWWIKHYTNTINLKALKALQEA